LCLYIEDFSIQCIALTLNEGSLSFVLALARNLNLNFMLYTFNSFSLLIYLFAWCVYIHIYIPLLTFSRTVKCNVFIDFFSFCVIVHNLKNGRSQPSRANKSLSAFLSYPDTMTVHTGSQFTKLCPPTPPYTIACQHGTGPEKADMSTEGSTLINNKLHAEGYHLISH
jgi:hypothetical protein